MSVEPTIGQFLAGILPRLQNDTKFPSWPPDLFALSLALLKRTGAYNRVLQDWPPDRDNEDTLENRTSRIRRLGGDWRTAIRLGQKEQFNVLNEEWEALCRSFDRPLSAVRSRLLCEAVMKLVAVADEASEGVGAPEDIEEDDFFLRATRAFLIDYASACCDIDPAILRVLPRMHTPQNGLTDRSLSLYLSLCDASQVAPQWLSTPFLGHNSINLLLIPRPNEVLVSQFRDVTDSATAELPEDFGFFTYDLLGYDEDFIGRVEALYGEAKRKLGRIDGVVLPELAITDRQFRDLRSKLPTDCFLVAGVGRSADAGKRGVNEVRLGFPPLDDLAQKKHHPWKLNEAQVVQYGLGGVLTPSRDWWEYTDFTDRCLNFVSISQDIVVCALICEDLARPDPVADIVRTVGPNLVIALLMDGPQTKERWAARYATVLADDPGCSVLALTSLGMTRLSRPDSGLSRSRVAALWKDAFKGATEIELPEGHEAVAVSLSIRYREEFTADGRGDDSAAAFPILAGAHPIADPRTSRTR